MRRNTTLLLLSVLLPYIAIADIPEGYYSAANGKKKAALKAAMHDIIRPLKKNLLEYGSGEGSTWSGFYITDRTANNQVIDRYSNDVRYFTSTTSAVSGMNIEHSFPKSWWGGSKNEAYQDLYNLMPSESKINSSKSNYAMGKVTNVKTDNGCTKVGTGPAGGSNAQLWEPADKWKGDFARDYFYMVTAYSDLNWTNNQALVMLENNDYPTMQEWAYTLLLQWAKDDPVDEIERKRNDDVYGIQQNRNPFVDFPNLAEYIWGDSVDFAFNVNGTSTGGGDDDPIPDFATLVDCSLKAGLDPFFVRTYDGCDGEVWKSSSSYGAVANAYNLPNREADEYLMVSLDLRTKEDAVLTFQHATGYNKTVQVKDTYFQVLVSYDYDGVPEDATWRTLDATFPPLQSNSNFTQYVSSGDISLAGCCGRDNVTLAFHYISNSSASYCWEIKDVKVTAYEIPTPLLLVTEDDEPEQPITYDLMGRRVPADTKGIVIRNGKKILQR